MSRLGAYNACYPPPNQCVAQGSKSLTLSPSGFAFIQSWEGFRSKVYNDAGGHCTIGYGHLIHKGACSGAASEADFMNGITKERGAELMVLRLGAFISVVQSVVNVELTQYEFDALVSFCFNAGSDAFKKSTLLEKVNSGAWKEVGIEFGKWVNSGGKKVPGLVRRRAAEAGMFLYGIYTMNS